VWRSAFDSFLAPSPRCSRKSARSCSSCCPFCIFVEYSERINISAVQHKLLHDTGTRSPSLLKPAPRIRGHLRPRVRHFRVRRVDLQLQRGPRAGPALVGAEVHGGAACRPRIPQCDARVRRELVQANARERPPLRGAPAASRCARHPPRAPMNAPPRS
jgi:hypothetical protein